MKTRAPEGHEVKYDSVLTDAKIEDDTEFDPEEPSVTKKFDLVIPVPISPTPTFLPSEAVTDP
jgi:hypothetical protein